MMHLLCILCVLFHAMKEDPLNAVFLLVKSKSSLPLQCEGSIFMSVHADTQKQKDEFLPFFCPYLFVHPESFRSGGKVGNALKEKPESNVDVKKRKHTATCQRFPLSRKQLSFNNKTYLLS